MIVILPQLNVKSHKNSLESLQVMWLDHGVHVGSEDDKASVSFRRHQKYACEAREWPVLSYGKLPAQH